LIDLLARGVDIPGDYEVVAVHVDGTDVGLPDQTAWLEPWFRELGVEYVIKPLEVPEQEPLPMDCFRCSWNRRKALFIAAGELGCHKVALGHHADDAAATTLLSMMYKGQVETLAPRPEFFQGRFLVIRPLITLSEAEIQRYARACGWASPSELACPREGSARRVRIEQFLATFPKKERHQIRANLWRVGQQGPQAQGGELPL
jgi:tRNA(Ile)-lysidine synthase TilS/MesJ